MNLKEGLRRIGITLGILGACAGAVLAYVATSPARQAWHDEKIFRTLLTTSTVRNATGAAWFSKHAPGADKWCDVDPAVKLPPGYKLVDPCYETNGADNGRLHWVELKPWERDWSKGQPTPGQVVNTVLRLESFAAPPNRDGIDVIHYDAKGDVISLELTNGEKIERPQA